MLKRGKNTGVATNLGFDIMRSGFTRMRKKGKTELTLGGLLRDNFGSLKHNGVGFSVIDTDSSVDRGPCNETT